MRLFLNNTLAPMLQQQTTNSTIYLSPRHVMASRLAELEDQVLLGKRFSQKIV